MDYKEAIEILKKNKPTSDSRRCGKELCTACDVAISCLQELQAIHDNGISLERLKDIDFRKKVVEHINYMDYMDLKDELEEYKQIGAPEEVREALEKEEKYHWHDLRKNPEDLPKNLSGIYLFENKWGQVFKGTFRVVGDIKLFETHIYSKDHGGDIWLQYKTCNVVRWKEIEPFEEN